METGLENLETTPPPSSVVLQTPANEDMVPVASATSQEPLDELPSLKPHGENRVQRKGFPTEIPDSDAVYDDWSPFKSGDLRAPFPPLQDVIDSSPVPVGSGAPEISICGQDINSDEDVCSGDFQTSILEQDGMINLSPSRVSDSGVGEWDPTEIAESITEQDVRDQDHARFNEKEVGGRDHSTQDSQTEGTGTNEAAPGSQPQTAEITCTSSTTYADGHQPTPTRNFGDLEVPFTVAPSQENNHVELDELLRLERHDNSFFPIQMSSNGDQTAELIEILGKERMQRELREDQATLLGSSASTGLPGAHSELSTMIEKDPREQTEEPPSSSIFDEVQMVEIRGGSQTSAVTQREEEPVNLSDSQLPDTLRVYVHDHLEDNSSQSIPDGIPRNQEAIREQPQVPDSDVSSISSKEDDDKLPATLRVLEVAEKNTQIFSANSQEDQEVCEPILQIDAGILPSDIPSDSICYSDDTLPNTLIEPEVSKKVTQVSSNKTQEDREVFTTSIFEVTASVLPSSLISYDDEELPDAPPLVEDASSQGKASLTDTEDDEEADQISVLPAQADTPSNNPASIADSSAKDSDEEISDAPQAEPEPLIISQTETPSISTHLHMNNSISTTLHVLVDMPPSDTPVIPDSEDEEELSDAPPSSPESAQQAEHVTIPQVPIAVQKMTIDGTDDQSADISSATEINVRSTISTTAQTPTQSFTPPLPKKETVTEPTERPPSPEKPTASSLKRKTASTPNTPFSVPASEGSQNKDMLMAELKAMKIASIQARNSSLEAELAAKRAKFEEVRKELKNPAAETVKRHIKLLHDYNDIRDVGQGLVGMIADNRGVRIGELYEEFGVGLKD